MLHGSLRSPEFTFAGDKVTEIGGTLTRLGKTTRSR